MFPTQRICKVPLIGFSKFSSKPTCRCEAASLNLFGLESRLALRMEEPIKPVSRRQRDDNLILSAGLSDGVSRIRPTGRQTDAGILLQHPTSRRRRPGNNCSVGVAVEN